jgi:glycosyltransferase involved in cell wall biosynthesis
MSPAENPPTALPFISIVMTTYNRADLLKRAVRSLERQTYKNFELIIVDDCSSDRTRDVISSLERDCSRIRAVSLEKNLGLSGARNRGMELASGSLVAFLDDDDEALPEWLESYSKRIPELPDTWGVLYSRYLIKEELTGVIYPNADPPREGYIFEYLMEGNHLPVGSAGAVIKKKALEEAGGFDESLAGLEDYDLWFRLSRNWTFHFINIPCILVYEHSGLRNSVFANTDIKVREHFLSKWRADMVRYGGEFVPQRQDQKEKAGRFFAIIRRETHEKGRLAGLRLLLRSSARNNFLPLYFLKDLFLILIGPTLYDHVRRIRGSLYWRFYRKTG